MKYNEHGLGLLLGFCCDSHDTVELNETRRNVKYETPLISNPQY
jgi:hypothetical protein